MGGRWGGNERDGDRRARARDGGGGKLEVAVALCVLTPLLGCCDWLAVCFDDVVVAWLVVFGMRRTGTGEMQRGAEQLWPRTAWLSADSVGGSRLSFGAAHFEKGRGRQCERRCIVTAALNPYSWV